MDGRKTAAAKAAETLVPEGVTEIVQDEGDATPTRGGARVQSLDRAFVILEAIAASPRGTGVAELARLSGLHTSTVFHLVRTLLALGYVRQEPESKRYRVGRKLFALAAGANDEANLVFLTEPVLRRLAGATGEAAHLAVRMGDSVVTIAKCDPASAIRMAERLGAVRPFHSTAIGKALLAALPDAQVESFLKRTLLQRYTEYTIVDPVELKRQIGQIRATGVAIDDREYNVEARCVAAMVRDFTGSVVAAIGISAPVWRLTSESLAGLRRVVAEHAQQLSFELGFTVRTPTSVAADAATVRLKRSG